MLKDQEKKLWQNVKSVTKENYKAAELVQNTAHIVPKCGSGKRDVGVRADHKVTLSVVMLEAKNKK